MLLAELVSPVFLICTLLGVCPAIALLLYRANISAEAKIQISLPISTVYHLCQEFLHTGKNEKQETLIRFSLIVRRFLCQPCEDPRHHGRASFPTLSKCLPGPGSLGRWGRGQCGTLTIPPYLRRPGGQGIPSGPSPPLLPSSLGDITQGKASCLHKSDSLDLKKVTSSCAFHSPFIFCQACFRAEEPWGDPNS